jgi:hypothetical protein
MYICMYIATYICKKSGPLTKTGLNRCHMLSGLLVMKNLYVIEERKVIKILIF